MRIYMRTFTLRLLSPITELPQSQQEKLACYWFSGESRALGHAVWFLSLFLDVTSHWLFQRVACSRARFSPTTNTTMHTVFLLGGS